MKPQRIQLSRTKGWRMPENTVKVDRTTRWGNPYQASVFGLERSIALFENTITGFWSPGMFSADEPDELVSKAYQAHQALQKRAPSAFQHYIRAELRGKNLACWCKLGAPCHADVLLKLANPDAGGTDRAEGGAG